MTGEMVPDNKYKCYACNAATEMNGKETICNFHQHFEDWKAGKRGGLTEYMVERVAARADT